MAEGHPLAENGAMEQDADDVRRLIAEGEGSRVEFKRGLPRPQKVARTLAAFANTRGGHFLVGVDDNGRLVGAPRPDETARELAEIGRDWVEPPVRVATRVIDVDGARVVIGWVRLSEQRPHRVGRGAD
ncbi:MAG: ATP-binding protein, partial [Planctomycetota bacterium]